jgi:L-seryl-tRNA(Ser) seleniumtransferase
VLGRRDLVESIARHPLSRVFRATPATLAGLAATLRIYSQNAQVLDRIPALQLLSAPLDNLRNRAMRLEPQVASSPAIGRVGVMESEAEPLPGTKLPTWRLYLTPSEGPAEQLAEKLWNCPTPLVGQIESGAVVLDLRSVLPRQDQAIAESIAGLAAERSESPGPASEPASGTEDG